MAVREECRFNCTCGSGALTGYLLSFELKSPWPAQHSSATRPQGARQAQPGEQDPQPGCIFPSKSRSGNGDTEAPARASPHWAWVSPARMFAEEPQTLGTGWLTQYCPHGSKDLASTASEVTSPSPIPLRDSPSPCNLLQNSVTCQGSGPYSCLYLPSLRPVWVSLSCSQATRVCI